MCMPTRQPSRESFCTQYMHRLLMQALTFCRSSFSQLDIGTSTKKRVPSPLPIGGYSISFSPLWESPKR